MHNPFVVQCPDCLAPAGQRCRIRDPRLANPPDPETGEPQEGMGVHANRWDAARLRFATHGTCALCSQVMYQATDPDDTWHPAIGTDDRMLTPCPPEPTTVPYDVEGWREFFTAGYRTGRPGAEHFLPDSVQPPPPEDYPMPPPPTVLPVPEATSDPMQDPPGSQVAHG